jgi:hypothetical protein
MSEIWVAILVSLVISSSIGYIGYRLATKHAASRAEIRISEESNAFLRKVFPHPLIGKVVGFRDTWPRVIFGTVLSIDASGRARVLKPASGKVSRVQLDKLVVIDDIPQRHTGYYGKMYVQ